MSHIYNSETEYAVNVAIFALFKQMKKSKANQIHKIDSKQLTSRLFDLP